MKLPCKEKYVDEAVPDWRVVENVGTNTYNVVHSDDIFVDIFINLTLAEAEMIVVLHNNFKTTLYSYMCRGTR